MRSQRLTRRNVPPERCDTSKWRLVDNEALSEFECNRFVMFQTAILEYLKTGKLKQISLQTGLSPSSILDQFNRCVTMAADGRPWGWAGLVRGLRLHIYERSRDLPEGAVGAASGFSGAFSRFLKLNSKIHESLNKIILARLHTGELLERNKSLKSIATDFKKMCIAAGIRNDQYPLNSKSCARKSLGRYRDHLIELEGAAGARSRYGDDAANRLRLATGTRGSWNERVPYDEGSLDAHRLDCIGCVVLPAPGGPERVPIERMWFIPLLEDESTAILGYSVGIRTEISFYNISETLVSAGRRWEPRKLCIPGLRYPEGGGLPSGVIPELEGCYPAIIKVDNAAVHYANQFVENARRRTGCVLSWGGIGRWDHNHIVERLFKTLESYGFHRLPSTTGSAPDDPIRRNAIDEAINHGITWEQLIDFTDVLVAEYNCTPSKGLGGRSPLQVLRDNLYQLEPTFLPRYLPPATVNQPELGVVIETRTVRGNQDQGRRPYIEFERCHYTSPVLARSFGLIGAQLRLHVREADLRVIQAFFSNGVELGLLEVQGGWRKTPHTREMRRQINLLCDAGELVWGAGDNPVEKFLEYLCNKTYRDSMKRPKSVSRSGTLLASVANVSQLPIPEPATNGIETLSTATPMQERRPLPSTLGRPGWKSVI